MACHRARRMQLCRRFVLQKMRPNCGEVRTALSWQSMFVLDNPPSSQIQASLLKTYDLFNLLDLFDLLDFIGFSPRRILWIYLIYWIYWICRGLGGRENP